MEEKIIDWVNFGGLIAELETKFGIKGLEITGGIVINRCGKKAIQFQSNDLQAQLGIMSKVFERLIVHNYGGSIDSTEPGMYWVPVDFYWNFKHGGSNGTHLLTAYYNESNETWRFEYER